MLVYSGGQVSGEVCRTVWIHEAIAKNASLIQACSIGVVRGGLSNKQFTQIAASVVAFEFTQRGFEEPPSEHIASAKRKRRVARNRA